MAALHAQVFTVPRPWTESEFAELLQSLHVFAVARAEGFALARVTADEGELLTLAVAPEARRRGAGRALLSEALDLAAERGAVTMFLEVAADNVPALALYKGSGFAQTGRRQGYYRSPEGKRTDALVLTRALSPP
jgi:ribosomal-protein-alanine N-acetyltransferase